ncbi:hypothetical protein PG985_013244 [Apiospora marii]|uniref:uncharacterized protein n=1 Tax=Apiospora marii TaxID=335849 RepID=UPI00312E683D
MASGTFQTLPEELLSEIEQALPFQDRLQLSAVDSRLRRCLTPGLYTSIRFSNRLDEQRAVADIIAKYGQYARGLALTLDLAVPEPEEGIDETEEPMTTTGDADWSARGITELHSRFVDRKDPARHLFVFNTLLGGPGRRGRLPGC